MPYDANRMQDDTTKPTSTEREAANRRARDVFLAAKRHDLRTPINAIIGYSEMMLEDVEGSGAEWSGDLDKIHEAGKSLLTTVNEMLNADKLESGDIDTSDMSAFGEKIRVAVRADISSVIGYSEMIAEDEEDLDEDTIADLERIRSSAVRMTDLVNDIASFGPDETESDVEGDASTEQADMVHDLVATHPGWQNPVSQQHMSISGQMHDPTGLEQMQQSSQSVMPSASQSSGTSQSSGISSPSQSSSHSSGMPFG